eukprot:CAMPEP_0176490800 /NCGR_PEP_ID=MMETSP0200_2-20121128/8073_1 /TAXON_ID=947934 /ORGANISM="Chaetoceros sp., Strain GSL56" /LENGTH=369 /DNA_ID=CAMNT_0017888149 /DNA_START=178 /DNA_END=1287 /DNA_ORIENTATION=+
MVSLSPRAEVIASVISYSLCSGFLVLVNKLILHYLPFPSIVIVIQLLSSVMMIYGGNFFGVMPIDEMKLEFLKPYMIYTVAFSTGVYTNMMCLNTSNVETVIVARACSPLVVSLLDSFFLGRELPSRRSFIALSLIIVGAYGYALTDAAFKEQGVSAYFWPTLYLALITFEMVYGKQIVRSVKFKTVSGPVQYTNLLGWPPMFMFAKMGGEFERLHAMMDSYDAKSYSGFLGKLPKESIALMVLGCLIGTGIGYSGWWCRGKVSATSFTLIGVLNKCITVLVNLMIWDQHASAIGIACLFICLIGGAFYEQAPMRKKDGDSEMKAQAEKDVEIASVSSRHNTPSGGGLTKRNADSDDETTNMTKPLIQK